MTALLQARHNNEWAKVQKRHEVQGAVYNIDAQRALESAQVAIEMVAAVVHGHVPDLALQQF